MYSAAYASRQFDDTMAVFDDFSRVLDDDLQFRLALIEDPDNLEFQRNMADLSFEQGIYAVAVQGYRKVIEQDSTDVDAFFKLGKSYYYQKMLK